MLEEAVNVFPPKIAIARHLGIKAWLRFNGWRAILGAGQQVNISEINLHNHQAISEIRGMKSVGVVRIRWLPKTKAPAAHSFASVIPNRAHSTNNPISIFSTDSAARWLAYTCTRSILIANFSPRRFFFQLTDKLTCLLKDRFLSPVQQSASFSFPPGKNW